MLIPLRPGELPRLIPAVATGPQFNACSGSPQKLLQRVFISVIVGVIWVTGRRKSLCEELVCTEVRRASLGMMTVADLSIKQVIAMLGLPQKRPNTWMDKGQSRTKLALLTPCRRSSAAATCDGDTSPEFKTTNKTGTGHTP